MVVVKHRSRSVPLDFPSYDSPLPPFFTLVFRFPNPILSYPVLLSYGRVVDELADSASEASAKNGGSAEMRDRVEAQAKEGRELLGELLRTVAALLASGPVHREEFLQVRIIMYMVHRCGCQDIESSHVAVLQRILHVYIYHIYMYICRCGCQDIGSFFQQ